MTTPQIPVPSGEQQVTVPVNPIDSSREAPDPYNSARRQSRPADQQLVDICEPLCNTFETIEGVRKALFEHRNELATSNQRHVAYEQAYHIERRARTKSDQAFANLYAHYVKTISDLQKMSNRCLSRHLEFESAHEPIIVRQRPNFEYNDLPITYEDYGISQSDWEVLERDIEKELVGASVGEDEEFDILRDHRSALGHAMNGIYKGEQEVPEEMQDVCSMRALSLISGHGDTNSPTKTGSASKGQKRKLEETF